MKRAAFLMLLVTTLFCGGAQANTQLSAQESLQTVLLRLPWSAFDRERETAEQRLGRAGVMSRALLDASHAIDSSFPKRQLIGATAAIWWSEARFSLDVHQGKRSRFGSDDGKAKCFGQLHERSVGISQEDGETLEDFRKRQKQVWESLAGTDYESTKKCALSTMRAWLSKVSMCSKAGYKSDDLYSRAYGAYGTGEGCESLKDSAARHKLAQKIARQM